jgi:hypothetical protein
MVQTLNTAYSQVDTSHSQPFAHLITYVKVHSSIEKPPQAPRRRRRRLEACVRDVEHCVLASEHIPLAVVCSCPLCPLQHHAAFLASVLGRVRFVATVPTRLRPVRISRRPRPRMQCPCSMFTLNSSRAGQSLERLKGLVWDSAFFRAVRAG